MPELLKSLVLKTIQEIYPGVNDDIILLVGSRALGIAQESSDIDILVFTPSEKYDVYKDISVAKGYRTEDADAGFEINIPYNGIEICLEVKFMTTLHISSLIDYFSFVNTICLNTDPNKDMSLKQDMHQRFDIHYEKNLMKAYITFFQDFKEMKGIMEKEKSAIMNDSLFIKKGVVLEGFLRLIYIIEKRGYPTTKRLLTLLQGELGDWALTIVERVVHLSEYSDLLLLESEIKDIINQKYMPPRPYVGARRKFLKEFKQN